MADFGQTVHAFCNVQTLLTNGIMLMSEDINVNDISLMAIEWEEYVIFKELLHMVPSLESHLMGSSEEMVTTVAELIQKGINSARADDTKGVKTTIIDWITPKGQSLNPHISQNMKSGRGFNHEHTGALLCPAGLDWANIKTRTKLVNGQIQVAGDQWPIFLYANYTYDMEDPWNGLFSVDQEPKATCSGNTQIHGMCSVTKASIVYIVTQTCFALTSAQIFSQTDLVTDSECFYFSIVELLDDPDEKEEVDQLMTWWNRQIFPLYADPECLPSRDSALARIHQKWMECRKRDTEYN
ncbi:hypothetical protein J3A83DRAFT_4185731 [Scleroderma citrinum]